jgi:hypothetical protein
MLCFFLFWRMIGKDFARDWTRTSEPRGIAFGGACPNGPSLRPNGPEKLHHDENLLAISRRTFVEGSARVALVAIGVTACVGEVPAVWQPWSDDTLWHDGTGWVD